MVEKSKDGGEHIVRAPIIFGCCFIFGAHPAPRRIQGAIDSAVEKMSSEVGRAADGFGAIATNIGQYNALMGRNDTLEK